LNDISDLTNETGCMLHGVYATRGVCYTGCMLHGVYATRGV